MAYDRTTPEGREAHNAARRKSYRNKKQDPAWVEQNRTISRWKMRELRENRQAAGLTTKGKPRVKFTRAERDARFAERLETLKTS